MQGQGVRSHQGWAIVCFIEIRLSQVQLFSGRKWILETILYIYSRSYDDSAKSAITCFLSCAFLSPRTAILSAEHSQPSTIWNVISGFANYSAHRLWRLRWIIFTLWYNNLEKYLTQIYIYMCSYHICVYMIFMIWHNINFNSLIWNDLKVRRLRIARIISKAPFRTTTMRRFYHCLKLIWGPLQ